jgi:hypothetical protein
MWTGSTRYATLHPEPLIGHEHTPQNPPSQREHPGRCPGKRVGGKPEVRCGSFSDIFSQRRH